MLFEIALHFLGLCWLCVLLLSSSPSLTIMQPIDLRTIVVRISDGTYNTLGECLTDFDRMINNATTFNEPGSQVS